MKYEFKVPHQENYARVVDGSSESVLCYLIGTDVIRGFRISGNTSDIILLLHVAGFAGLLVMCSCM